MSLAVVRKTDYTNTHVDVVTTNQAMEFFQDDMRFLCVRDVPVITVDQPSGILSVLNRDDLNRDEVRGRSRNAQAEKAGFGFLDLPYKTDERSLEYDVNASQAAGATPGRNPALTVPFALAYKGSIHTEVRLATSIFDNTKWFRTVTGNAADGADAADHSAQNRKFWNDPTSDPVSAVRFEIDIFIIVCGLMPTNLRLGRTLFTTIATNPNVRAQVAVLVNSGAGMQTSLQPKPATEEQLSALFGLKVSVSSAIQNLADKGLPANNAFIVPPKDGLLSYDTPTQYTDGKTPTAFARVVSQHLFPNGLGVRTFPRPEIGPGGSEASVIDLFNGFLIVDNKCGTYLKGMCQ
jgi:hypothetical protein